MHCKKCGKEISENSKFCTYCGSDINKYNANEKLIKKIICIVSGIVGIIFIICIAMYIINNNSTIVASNSDLNNTNSEEAKDKEIFDYLCEESCKIYSKTRDSIFLKGTSEHSDMVAIKDLKLGTVDNSSTTLYQTTTFLNGDIESVGVNLILKNDKIEYAFVNVVYTGQYYLLGYDYSSHKKFGGTSPQDMNYYVGQITYRVNCDDYSQITFLNDQRFDKQYGSQQYFSGEEFNIADSDSYFKSILKDGVVSDIEFVRNGVNVDVTTLISDNEKLIVKFDTEDYNTNLNGSSVDNTDIDEGSDSEVKTNKQSETDQTDISNITQQPITSNVSLVLNSMRTTSSNNYELVVQVSISTNGDWNSIANTLKATANGNEMNKTISNGTIIFKYPTTLNAGDNAFSVSVNGDGISKTENYNVTLNLPQLYIHNNMLTDTMGNYTSMDISVSSGSYSGGNYISEGITITVNGKGTEQNGSSYKYRISEGETSFNIVVTDSYGQTFTKTVSI